MTSENGEYVLMEKIGKYFELKEDSIGPPDISFGGKLCKVDIESGVKAWAIVST